MLYFLSQRQGESDTKSRKFFRVVANLFQNSIYIFILSSHQLSLAGGNERCIDPCANVGHVFITETGMAKLLQIELNYFNEDFTNEIKKETLPGYEWETPCSKSEIDRMVADAHAEVDALKRKKANLEYSSEDDSPYQRMSNQIYEVASQHRVKILNACPGIPRVGTLGGIGNMIGSLIKNDDNFVPERTGVKVDQIQIQDLDYEVSKVTPISPYEYEVEISFNELSLSTCANVELLDQNRTFFKGCGLMASLKPNDSGQRPTLTLRGTIDPKTGDLNELARVKGGSSDLQLNPGNVEFGLAPLTDNQQQRALDRLIVEAYDPFYQTLKTFERRDGNPNVTEISKHLNEFRETYQSQYLSNKGAKVISINYSSSEGLTVESETVVTIYNDYITDYIFNKTGQLPQDLSEDDLRFHVEEGTSAFMAENNLTVDGLFKPVLPRTRIHGEFIGQDALRRHFSKMLKESPQLLFLPQFSDFNKKLNVALADGYEFNSVSAYNWYNSGSQIGELLLKSDQMADEVAEVITAQLNTVETKANERLSELNELSAKFQRAPLPYAQDLADYAALEEKTVARINWLSAYESLLDRVGNGETQAISQTGIQAYAEMGGESLDSYLSRFDQSSMPQMKRLLNDLFFKFEDIALKLKELNEKSSSFDSAYRILLERERRALEAAMFKVDKARKDLYARARSPDRQINVDPVIGRFEGGKLINGIEQLNISMGEALAVPLYSSNLPCDEDDFHTPETIPTGGRLVGKDNTFDVATTVSEGAINDYLKEAFDKGLFSVCGNENPMITCRDEMQFLAKLSKPPKVILEDGKMKLAVDAIDGKAFGVKDQLKETGDLLSTIASAFVDDEIEGELSVVGEIEASPCANGSGKLCLQMLNVDGKASFMFEMGGAIDKIHSKVETINRKTGTEGISAFQELRLEGVRYTDQQLVVYWQAQERERERRTPGEFEGLQF